ncbi:immunity 49 family protein [Nocardiopsis tropica]|uniref:Immunity 49 family protein n=1 Tax=Nocardiopsis tropica TaxID=109330 RepID=A0ABU7KPR9_9ACTN|nr:immunity 49 family protein [Nocardiopsis umidischolae]MEE2051273.1 immunity 49 family protein [Nocardiopsis umidischolae]
MTTYIARHDMDPGNTGLEVTEADLQRQIKRREKMVRQTVKDASNIGLWTGPAFLGAEIALLVDPPARDLETWEAWTVAMQFHNAVFALSEAEKGSTVEYLIDQQVRTLESPGLIHTANVGTWQTAFFLAVTCRANTHAEALCRIPTERLRRAGEAGGITHNEFSFHWTAALQAYVNGTDDLAAELRQAMELSDPRRGAFGGEYLDLVTFPQMDVFRLLLMGDAAAFNQALAEALESFKRYQTREDAPAGVHGVVPLGLLAIACLAYDKAQINPDFSLDVESEYLPEHIVKRSWYGEFPV